MTRPLLAPEVIQIGQMDCGPAVLKCMASAYGVTLDLERVRDACQTSIDGTSIDTLEVTLNAVGIPARQYVVPDTAFYYAATAYAPFILVVRNVGSGPHFVVVWRAAAGRIQVMDPAAGRLWVTPDELIAKMFLHA